MTKQTEVITSAIDILSAFEDAGMDCVQLHEEGSKENDKIYTILLDNIDKIKNIHSYMSKFKLFNPYTHLKITAESIFKHAIKHGYSNKYTVCCIFANAITNLCMQNSNMDSMFELIISMTIIYGLLLCEDYVAVQ